MTAPHPYDEMDAGDGTSGDRPGSDVISLGDYAAMVRRRWPILLICTVLGAAIGWTAFELAPKTYAAESVVALLPHASTTSSSRSEILPNTERTIASSSEVSVLARDRLAEAGLYSAALDYRELVRKREVTVPPQTQALVFRFSADRPEQAAAGANAFAEAYLNYRADLAARNNKEQADRIRDARLAREAQLAKLDARAGDAPGSSRDRGLLVDRIAELRSQEDAVRTSAVRSGRLVNRAEDPRLPAAPRWIVFVAGGMFAGFLLGAIIAMRRERSDDRIRSAAALERHLGAPLLTSIPVPRSLPADAGLALDGAPESAEAAGYRTLAAKLLAPGVGAGRRILVTGPSGGDPRVAANLVIALAELGKRVTYVGAPEGLSRLLRGAGDPAPAEVVSRAGEAVPVGSVPGLRVAAIHDDALADGVDAYLEDFNVVVIDGSDVIGDWQVLALAGQVDSVLVVLAPRRSGKRALTAMVDELHSVAARICGGVRLTPSRSAPVPEGGVRREHPSEPVSAPSARPADPGASAPSAPAPASHGTRGPADGTVLPRPLPDRGGAPAAQRRPVGADWPPPHDRPAAEGSGGRPADSRDDLV